MTKYEFFNQKIEHCRQAQENCYNHGALKMGLVWAVKRRELEKKRDGLTVAEAESTI